MWKNTGVLKKIVPKTPMMSGWCFAVLQQLEIISATISSVVIVSIFKLTRKSRMLTANCCPLRSELSTQAQHRNACFVTLCSVCVRCVWFWAWPSTAYIEQFVYRILAPMTLAVEAPSNSNSLSLCLCISLWYVTVILLLVFLTCKLSLCVLGIIARCAHADHSGWAL